MNAPFSPLLSLVSGSCIWLGAFASAAPTYEVIILPFTTPGGVNNAGQVVGIDAGNDTVFRWENGTNVVIASMPTAFPAYASQQGIYNSSISENGTMAGQIGGALSGQGTDTRAVTFSGLATDLGALPGSTSFTGGQSANLQAVNDSGVAVGTCTDNTAATKAVIYTGSSVIQIGTANGGASDINNSGQVVGTLTNTTGFLTTGPSPTTLVPLAGHTVSQAFGINSDGIIVGRSAVSGAFGDPHSMVTWNNGGAPTDLGSYPAATSTLAKDINSSLEIVGRAFAPGTVIFYYDGAFHLLDGLFDPSDPDGTDLTLTSVAGINDNGWIAARGTKTGVGTVGVLLKPMAPVPVLAVISTKYVGGGSPEFRVTVPSKVGFEYQLKHSTDVAMPFVDVGSPVAGTGSPLELTHPVAAGGKGFYSVTETEL